MFVMDKSALSIRCASMHFNWYSTPFYNDYYYRCYECICQSASMCNEPKITWIETFSFVIALSEDKLLYSKMNGMLEL